MSEEVCVEGGREGLVEQEPQARHICGGGTVSGAVYMYLCGGYG